MTVVCVHARSHVPILALVQISSAGFFEKKKIIAPVITVWERFSVAESHKCHNPPPQPISCFSTESLVVNELRDWACDYTWEFARETFLCTSTKKHYYSFCSSSSAACPSHLCSLSPPPHQLSASHHAEERTQTDTFLTCLPAVSVSGVCFCVYVC